MAAMTLKTIVLGKTFKFAFWSFFVNLLPSRFNYKSHMILLTSGEGALAENLMF